MAVPWGFCQALAKGINRSLLEGTDIRDDTEAELALEGIAHFDGLNGGRYTFDPDNKQITRVVGDDREVPTRIEEGGAAGTCQHQPKKLTNLTHARLSVCPCRAGVALWVEPHSLRHGPALGASLHLRLPDHRLQA